MLEIRILKSVDKTLKIAPVDVREKFDLWRRVASLSGPQGLLQISGFRDHGLKGQWKGARASSLNYQWRVIYKVDLDARIIFVLSISPHDYRRKL